MSKQYMRYVVIGGLSLVALATAQVTPRHIIPDTLNTNKLSACEDTLGFMLLMDGTRAGLPDKGPGLAQTLGNAPTATSLGTSWRDTIFTDSANGPGTRAVYKTSGSANDITSKLLYADFDVRISYRNSDNSGFFYRGKRSSNPPWNTAVEVGIDNTHSRAVKEQTGSVFDIFPPQPLQAQTTFLFNSLRWNELRIIAIGDSIEHWVNGIRVAAYRTFTNEYFSGRGVIAGANTGYANSKWNSSKAMGFEVANTVSAGPILRGVIGVQGAHPGSMMIRNFRIDTIPSWAENNHYYPDTISCLPVSVRPAPAKSVASSAPMRVSYPGNNRVVFSIPGGSLREAMLVDAFGRIQMKAHINGQNAEFEKIPDNGVYFLRYRSALGTYSAPISLIGDR